MIRDLSLSDCDGTLLPEPWSEQVLILIKFYFYRIRGCSLPLVLIGC